MSKNNIQFIEETFDKKHAYAGGNTKIVNFLIENNFVETKRQANILLLIITVVVLFLGIYVFAGLKEPQQKVVPYELLPEAEKQTLDPENRYFIEKLLNITN